MFFDTHAHLNDEQFNLDIENVFKKSKEKNVNKIVIASWDIESSKKAIEIAKRKDVYAAVGIHPSQVKSAKDDDLKEIEKLLKSKNVVALGEIGLDFYWDKENKKEQEEFFKKQIELAYKYKKPIIIHSRDAAKDTYRILSKKKTKIHKCVMHCFSYPYEEAKKYLDLGFYISLGGPTTFLNAKEPLKNAKRIDLNKLLIETDSPYLAPHPYRGKRNDPSLLPLICEKICHLRQEKKEDIVKQIYNNSLTFFDLKE